MNQEIISSPLFIKYLKSYENNPRSIVFAPLAEIYRKEGKIEKAIEILKEGLKYNPSYVTGYLSLASCYADLSKYHLAYSLLKSLIETNRDNIKLQKLFADVCLKTNQEDEALEAYKYLLFLTPKDREVAAFVKQLEDQEEEPELPPRLPFKNEAEQFHIADLPATPYQNEGGVDHWKQMDFTRKKRSSEQLEKIMWAFYKNIRKRADEIKSVNTT